MHGTHRPLPCPQRAPSRQRSRIMAWLAWLDRCLTSLQERRQLRQLDSHQLKDIGLSRADVERECRRWPWDYRAWD